MTAHIIAAAISAIAPASQQLPITITADVPYYSKYVWRGINVINDPVIQPSINLAFQGWNLNLWGNYDINNAKRFNEYDVTLNYSQPFAQGSWTLGYIDYAFPGAALSHTREFYGQLNFGQSWNPYIATYFDVDEADGIYAKIGGSNSFPTEFGDIVLHGWLGYGDKKYNNFYYANNEAALADFGLEATWSKSLAPNTTGYIKASYTTLVDKDQLNGAANRSNFVFGFGLGISF
jgi:hypothetical protein